MSESITRILIADAHLCSRIGLYQILADEGLEIVAEVDNVDNLHHLVQDSRPHLLLLACNLLPDASIPFLTELRCRFSKVNILLYLDSRYKLSLQEASSIGVSSLVLKTEPIDFIIQAVKSAANGGTAISSVLLNKAINQPDAITQAAKFEQLTVRERQILRLMCEDKSNREIAQALQVSRKTVEKQLTALYAKLEVNTRVGAVVWFMKRPYGNAGGGGDSLPEIVEEALPKCRGFPVGVNIAIT